ncbi:adenosine deaminase [Candidatus Fermentibacteria bacterium]|nr:MAG: adenosine deaminase [Candidatus Fermentibacteria bacterium]
MEITRDLIKEIPKTDLHLHLDGSIRIETLIELARQEGVELPSYSVEGLCETVFKENYESLEDYLKGFEYTCAVMRNRENIERIAYELALDNQAEGVRYIEVRFAPQLHAGSDMNILQTIEAVHAGLERARRQFNNTPEILGGKEPPFEYGIITCAMRFFDRHFSDYFNDIISVHSFSEADKIFGLASMELAGAAIMARRELEIPVVGVDIAGPEKGNPPIHHRGAYMLAQRNFIKKTVHAGEAYGPESIYQAITELGADRIGHGTSLFNPEAITDPAIRDREEYVNDLVQFIADRRITIEVCLTSNMQTDPTLASLEDHPFRQMMDNRISCSICTDNRTVSHTTVTDELYKAVKVFNLTEKELQNLIVYGFKRSFFPGSYREKRAYVRQCMEFFEKVTANRSK